MTGWDLVEFTLIAMCGLAALSFVAVLANAGHKRIDFYGDEE